MGIHWNRDHEDRLHASWTDNIQEFISNLATNFYLVKASATAIKLVAGTDEDQVSIGLGGPWRYRTEDYTLNISGGAGTKTIWAVAVTANDFEGAGEDPDETDYDFELRATTGAEPGSVFYARKVGTVVWDGAAITSIQQTVNKTTGAMIESGALSGSGDVEWTQEASGAWVPQLKANSVDTADLKDGAVTGDKLTKSIRENIGVNSTGEVRRGKAIIDTEQSTNSAAFTVLTTPDRVANIVLQTDGLLYIAYKAAVEIGGAAVGGSAAIFIGGNQLKIAKHSGEPKVQQIEFPNGLGGWDYIVSSPIGLQNVAFQGGSDVITGQVLGGTAGGIVAVYMAAGTYDVEIRYKAIEGKGTAIAKNRKLWVWSESF